MSEKEYNELNPESSYKFHYSGNGTELAFIMFKNFFLSIITFGIYFAWGRTNIRRYIWGHTHFLGDRANYTGTGRELFVGMLKALFIYAVVLLPLIILSKSSSSVAITFLPLKGIVVYGALHYRFSRTTWRGVNFGLDKNSKLSSQFANLWFIYPLITLLTFGLVYPIMVHEIRSFLVNKMKLGDSYFKYTGTTSGLFMIYGKAILLIPMTLGLYYFWFRVEEIRYRLEHTHFQSAHFRINLKGRELFRLSVLSFFLTLFTLGLAIPWVVNMFHRLIVNSIDLYGTINLEEVKNSQLEGSDGAAADAGATGYDMDIAV
jgi:uncharacterized membrane protein YjgN (DUF898 family)